MAPSDGLQLPAPPPARPLRQLDTPEAAAPSPGRGALPAGIFLAGLAFLLAPFPARNGDLWMHLAAGRDLLRGEHSLAAFPRPDSGLGAPPGWLYDVLSYGLYAALGGPGLVLGKALLVAG